MKYQDNIEAVADLQPDYIGFIFYDKSSRFFDGEVPEISRKIKKVGVFVNNNILDIIRKTLNNKLDIIQLHGSETPAFCNALKEADFGYGDQHLYKKHNFKIIKVFSIKNEFDFEILRPYEGIVDYFLFDTKGKLPGGNGYTFNWDVLKDYPSTTPYFLSGGIGLNEVNNIKEFKKSSASKYCYAIDVNSKFEIEPGLKNINELEKFKSEIRHIERT